MKMIIEDEFDEMTHEFEVPDDLYERAFNDNDKGALYEIASMIYSSMEVSDIPVLDMMTDAWDEGDGDERAGAWLDEYYADDDDGRYDSWV